MKYLIIYKKETGDVVAFKSPYDDQGIDTPTHGYLIADIDPSQTNFFVKNGAIATRPEKPKDYYWWNGTEWLPDLDMASTEAKNKRDELLLQSDWTELQGAQHRMGVNLFMRWQDYRQALRDITKQSGFPLNIIWPEKPV